MIQNKPSSLQGDMINSLSVFSRILTIITIICIGALITLLVMYVKTYAQNVPLNDQALYSVPTALTATTGNFSLPTILEKNVGHRIVWTNLVTYAFTSLTKWDILAESWVSLFLAILILAILIRLLYFSPVRPMLIIIILFSALIFSLNQQFNWLWALHNCHFFSELFFLLAVATVLQNKLGWRSLYIAASCCFCSLFSHLPGIISWPTVLIVLVACGYRDKKYYIFWIAASIASIVLYSSNLAVGVTKLTTISIPTNIAEWIIFILVILGSPLFFNNFVFSALIGFLGLIFFVVTTLYLGYYCKKWLFVGIWSSLAFFSIANAVLIGLGRLEIIGVDGATSTWYITHTQLLWCAVIVMSVESSHILRQRIPRWRKFRSRLIQIMGYILIVCFVVLYTFATVRSLQDTANFFQKPFGSDVVGMDEKCILEEPLTQNKACLRLSTENVPEMLLRYQLAAFAQPTRLHLLPDDYQLGDTIVFDSKEMALHSYLDTVWFSDERENLFHIAPEVDIQNLSVKIADGISKQLWYIRVDGNIDLETFSTLINRSYIPDFHTLNGRLEIVKYRRQ